MFCWGFFSGMSLDVGFNVGLEKQRVQGCRGISSCLSLGILGFVFPLGLVLVLVQGWDSHPQDKCQEWLGLGGSGVTEVTEVTQGPHPDQRIP